jgi:hypothetical protein
MPSTVSGRAEAAAIEAIGSEDVFDANTAPSGIARSASTRSFRFRARSSYTASTTRSTLPNPAQPVVPVTRFIACSASNGFMRRRFTRPARYLLTWARPRRAEQSGHCGDEGEGENPPGGGEKPHQPQPERGVGCPLGGLFEVDEWDEYVGGVDPRVEGVHLRFPGEGHIGPEKHGNSDYEEHGKQPSGAP